MLRAPAWKLWTVILALLAAAYIADRVMAMVIHGMWRTFGCGLQLLAVVIVIYCVWRLSKPR
jgi:RsiW-degrading membrane proteinase PrsW (M82 family)